VIWSTIRISVPTWILLRGILAGASGSPTILLPASIFLVFGVCAVALVDSSVARERLFLANLGVGRRAIAGISLSVACALELAAAIALGAIG
jgi:hypothetical protein